LLQSLALARELLVLNFLDQSRRAKKEKADEWRARLKRTTI
jgi:hypothetical protein